MSTMANTPEGAYHAKRAALVKHRALEADNARQRALIAELVGALEGILKRSVARGTLEIPCDGPIADLIRAVLAKAREESA